MRREEIAAKVAKVVEGFEAQAKASKQLGRGQDSSKVMEAMNDAEAMVKVALLDIAVDTLHVLHRIADALEGQKGAETLFGKPREKL